MTTELPAIALPSDGLGQAPRRKRVLESTFRGVLTGCVSIGAIALVTLIGYMVYKGWDRLDSDLWTRFANPNPALAGAKAAIFGTIWVMVITGAIAVPVGVGAAVYLEEFADRTKWYNRFIELNIQNLAAVPSVVFGILGLAFIARGPLSWGPTILTAGVILAMVVLPVVIIASREAIRAVPSSIREGALALGATPWQVVWRQVLPAAIPGIATGVILALSRAIGEAAPLILLGALVLVTFTPAGLDSRFSVLPVQILAWVQRPQAEFQDVAAAAGVLLLVMLLAMNAVAIFIRQRASRRW